MGRLVDKTVVGVYGNDGFGDFLDGFVIAVIFQRTIV
jgi:hypothetical protein